jgi:uncharacterized protein YpuA (DUF1002 family)
MTFNIGSVEFRWDTLLNTILLILTGIICTIVLTHHMSLSDVQNRVAVQRLAIVAAALDHSVNYENNAAQQLISVRAEHTALLKQEQSNAAEIRKLETMLRNNHKID